MDTLASRLASVRERIASATERANRPPASVALLAVTKGHPAEAIREAFALGQRAFGESYVQELAEKRRALIDLPIDWHFIGHLQRNKVKELLKEPCVVHSLDRPELALELDKRASARLGVFIEVNVAREEQKSGCDPKDVEALARAVGEASHLHLRGLMTVPPASDDQEASRPWFRELATIARGLAERGLLAAPYDLSMGMSHDFEIAIAEGATLVRVGTDIFGPRASAPPRGH